MIGGKTEAPRTMLKQESDIAAEFRIIAGSGPFEIFFDNLASHHIADCYDTNKEETPPPAFGFKIRNNKNEDEEIKRSPHNSFTEIGYQEIEKRISEVVI